MTGPGLRLRERVPVAELALDPPFGTVLAQRWVADHLPGRRLLRTRTHSALYRGGDDLSVRVSADLDGGTVTDPGLTLLVRTQAGDVSTTAFPDDPALPTLAPLLDPATAARVVAGAVAELSQADARGARWGVTVVHHPRTGACVLRYDVTRTTEAPAPFAQLYAKVYPTCAQARAAAAALTAVGRPLLETAFGPPVRLPRLLGLDEDLHVVLLESLGATDGTAVDVQPVEAARALRALHDRAPVSALPRVSPADEVARARVELALARTVWPDLTDLVTPHVDRAADLLVGTPQGRPVLSHGDFTPSQLVRLPEAIGLLDLDTLRMAEAACDVGRYLAYHELAVARRSAGPVTADDPRHPGLGTGTPLTALLTAYEGGTAGDRLVPQRVLAYRCLNLALVALRAARRFKEQRVHLALTLLDHPRSPEGVRDDHDDV